MSDFKQLIVPLWHVVDENVTNSVNFFKPNLDGRLTIVRNILYSGFVFVRYKDALYLVFICYPRKIRPPVAVAKAQSSLSSEDDKDSFNSIFCPSPSSKANCSSASVILRPCGSSSAILCPVCGVFRIAIS